MLDDLGIVVIGRNEGERLKASLASLPANVPVVYVDSGSLDGSPDYAEGEGAHLVCLTAETAFSAARARNEGFARLREVAPQTGFVQFLDGDCVLLDGWLAPALTEMRKDPGLAVVAGRRLERFPEASWYNSLCHIEWNTPVGEARAVGGDALYRVSAFEAAGGFDPRMMAGEEPELCLRLRRQGGRIKRLPYDMTLHDADIHSFGEWWKRALRSGYASMLGFLKHGRDGYRVREVLRALLWGGALPSLLIVGTLFIAPFLVLLIGAIYAAKWLRLRKRFQGKVDAPGRYAFFLMLTNVAEVQGIFKALRELITGKRSIVEYKRSASSAVSPAAPQSEGRSGPGAPLPRGEAGS